LEVSEDRLEGFPRHPFREISKRSGVPLETVLERLRSMREAGVIRRIRQTFFTTNLAESALVAWRVPEEKLNAAFDDMVRNDPRTGHVVIRSCNSHFGTNGTIGTIGTIGTSAMSQESQASPLSSKPDYRLWTTLKLPAGESLKEHCEAWRDRVSATAFRLLPARGIFSLGVGHLRRRSVAAGALLPALRPMKRVELVRLTDAERRVVAAVTPEISLEEIADDLWQQRASRAGIPLEDFYATMEDLDKRGLVGRFTTILEHVKPAPDGSQVTRCNALLAWALPTGCEERGGQQIARHEIVTHCYWRDGGEEFRGLNIWAMVHCRDRETVLTHKAAMDAHLARCGLPVGHTAILWSERSEVNASQWE